MIIKPGEIKNKMNEANKIDNAIIKGSIFLSTIIFFFMNFNKDFLKFFNKRINLLYWSNYAFFV